jgi:hypothetical protein
MSKSDWQKLGLALSGMQCILAAKHRRGAHPVINKACLFCLLKWAIGQ